MRKNFLLLMLLLPLCSLAQKQIQLEDMDLSKVWQEYGNVAKGQSVTGQKVMIDGMYYEHVIGNYGKTIMRIQLDGRARNFSSQVSVLRDNVSIGDPDITVQPLTQGGMMLFKTTPSNHFVGYINKGKTVQQGKVQFIIKGDGKELYRSSVVQGGDKPIGINVKLDGVRQLDLEIDCTKDGASGDNAIWIDPMITYSGAKPQMIDVNSLVGGPKMSDRIQKRLFAKISSLPVFNELASTKTSFDWLIKPELSKANIYATPDRKSIVVANGMVWRTFHIFPNLATTDYVNRMTGERMLRAVGTEGVLSIDGKTYQIGGLAGQVEKGYLLDKWIDSLRTIPHSFLVTDFEIKDAQPLINWKSVRWILNTRQTTGKELIFTLKGTDELSGVNVRLHYVVYDELPVIRKSFEIINGTSRAINIDSFELERLSFFEPESPSGGDPSTFLRPNIHVESDYNCHGSFTEKETDITEHWVTDSTYTSQRNYLLQTPCVLSVMPPIGPDKTVSAGETFQSFHVFEMPFDSYDRERKGLFTRHFYRAMAPWSNQNPIFLHLTTTKANEVRRAIDQCADTGYEMIIFSFGSGLNVEDTTETNIQKYKAYVDYAHSKGIQVGCYSLLASRAISDSVDVINPKTGRIGGAIFGNSPCISTHWGHGYLQKVRTFFERTGMDCFEHDGSYPGDVCASTCHAFHKGLNDSQWTQYYQISDLYHWMCERGIYINVPDFYFLSGSTKTSIGYREVNWSLPRDRQIVLARQLNFDCTWERTPSMLWSFVPLVEYHGGGAAATMEPLHEHLYEYRMHMVQNYGAGVQACYRGTRLYDSEETRQMVKDVISWYKKYRTILNSDIIHLRKPDARDWDGIMHVDPNGTQKALALLFNPLGETITRNITLPLYYTGLQGSINIREGEGADQTYQLDKDSNVTLTVTIPAYGYQWLVVEK